MNDRPAWTTEPVEIVAPDPDWSAQARREREDLATRLAPWLRSDIEHVGSTAVPGLAAKPILDLQALVENLDVAGEIASVLDGQAWHLVLPELDARPGRRLFVKVRDGHRHAHLHLMTPGAPRWAEQLRFRDALRRDPALGERYAALKRELAAETGDRERYTEAKTRFVRGVLADPDVRG